METRHNLGFMAVDSLVCRASLSWGYSAGLRGYVTELRRADRTFILLKPATYMNLSGKSVQACVERYGLDPACLIVVHDDLDLEFGRIKISENQGPGGHNGVRSIIEELQNKSFVRIKCGIGRPSGDTPVIDYVLSPFAPNQRERLPAVLDTINNTIELIIELGVVGAMNRVNQKVESPARPSNSTGQA